MRIPSWLLIMLTIGTAMCAGFDTNAFKSAIGRNDVDTVRKMLDAGVSPSLTWEYNGSPLISAAGNNLLDIARLILDRGATNLDQRESWADIGETAIIKAAKKGNTAVACVLAERGAGINLATAYGWTPLMFAARNDDRTLMDMLLARGSFVDATNAEGFTALMIAADHGNQGAVERLCAARAGIDRSANSFTALTLAIGSGHLRIAKTLIERGASTNGLSQQALTMLATPFALGRVSKGLFSYELKEEQGRQRIELSFHGTAANKPLMITATPSGGNRIDSLTVGGVELLHRDPALPGMFDVGGIPILYPTPNRITDGTISFAGVKVVLKHPAAPTPITIHGYAKDSGWRFSTPDIFVDRAEYTAKLSLSSNSVLFPSFPWPHTIHITYAVMQDRVRIAYMVTNEGAKRFGFGFGLHPYWRVIGTPAQVRLQTDIKATLKDMLAANVLPVDAMRDISTPRPVVQVSPNDMYFKRTPKSVVSVYFDAIGVVLRQFASDDFTHLVTWAPPGKPYFSVEDQTCCADVHNQFAKGSADTAHLIIVEPGRIKAGFVEYIISDR